MQKNVSLIVDITLYEPSDEYLEPTRPCKETNGQLVKYDLHQSNVTFVVNNIKNSAMSFNQFMNFEKLTFKNIHFLEMPLIKNGNIVEFLGCTFHNDADSADKVNYSSLEKLVFSNCTFAPKVLYVNLFFFREFSFLNIRNILFLDSSFSFNYDFGNVLLKFSQCINVTFCSCSFTNNSKITIYSSKSHVDSQDQFGIEHLIITNCSFLHNKVFPLRGLILAAPLVLEIFNTIFAHNQITSYGTNNIEALVMIDAPSHVTIVNVTFQSNVGLGIYISFSFVQFSKLNFIDVHFINNTGVNAAGVFMSFTVYEMVYVNITNVSFQANHYISDYGGGIFNSKLRSSCTGYKQFYVSKQCSFPR